MDINDIEMSVRVANCLRSEGISTVERLINTSWKDLEKAPNLGSKAISEIVWSVCHLMTGEVLSRAKAYDEWKNENVPKMNEDDYTSPKIIEHARRYAEISRIVKKG